MLGAGIYQKLTVICIERSEDVARKIELIILDKTLSTNERQSIDVGQTIISKQQDWACWENFSWAGDWDDEHQRCSDSVKIGIL